MKFLHLIVRNALRNRLRTVLTVGGSAFLLFVLIFMLTALSEMEGWSGDDTHNRVAVQSSTGLATPLPIELEDYLRKDKIARRTTCLQKFNWFGGEYQDPKNFFPRFACDPEVLLQMWDEYRLPPEQHRRFCEQKNGCIAGAELAKRYEWKIGRKIPIKGDIYPCDLDLELVGTFTSNDVHDEEQLFFRWDYLVDLIGGRKPVGLYWLKARTPADIPFLKEQIDGDSKNSADPTETMTESEFGAQFMEMMGNVKGLITNVGMAILVVMALMTANTMAMSARERVTEIAVLRTLGFTSRHIFFLVIAESLFVTLLGAAISLGLALLVFNVLHGSPSPQFYPHFLVVPKTIVTALLAAVACGLVSAAVPAVRSARRKIVDGLRQVV